MSRNLYSADHCTVLECIAFRPLSVERLQSRPRESATPLPRRSPCCALNCQPLSYSFSGRRPMNKRLTTPKGVRAVPGAESDFIDDAKPTNDEWFRCITMVSCSRAGEIQLPTNYPPGLPWVGRHSHADRTRAAAGALRATRRHGPQRDRRRRRRGHGGMEGTGTICLSDDASTGGAA